jgi:hypothetical protein
MGSMPTISDLSSGFWIFLILILRLMCPKMPKMGEFYRNEELNTSLGGIYGHTLESVLNRHKKFLNSKCQ